MLPFDQAHAVRRIGSRLKLAASQAILRYKPIFTLGQQFPGITVITRREDVVDVLNRDQEFSVAPYGVKLQACLGSPTVLGMSDGPAYRRELAIMSQVLKPEDLPALGGFVYDTSQEVIRQAVRHKPSLDLVSELGDPVALRYIEHYFGLPDPGHGVLLRWLRMMSYYVFQCYLGTGPRIEIPAVRAAHKLMEHIHHCIAARRDSQSERPDDVLERLLQLRNESGRGLDDREIATILATLVSGGMNATFWLVVNVVDRLLDLPPEQLESARQAARHGQEGILREYVREAGRFYPAPIVVWRYCERDAVIARGTDRETQVPEGRLLALFLLTANMDPELISDPQHFRPARPPSEAMLFGNALHYCVGDRVGTEVVSQMVKALLMQAQLCRKPGIEGTKQFGPKDEFPAGKYPARLVVDVCG